MATSMVVINSSMRTTACNAHDSCSCNATPSTFLSTSGSDFAARFLFAPDASSSVVWTGGSPVFPKNLPEAYVSSGQTQIYGPLAKGLLATHGSVGGY